MIMKDASVVNMSLSEYTEHNVQICLQSSMGVLLCITYTLKYLDKVQTHDITQE
jgi:hypothetical protein